MYQFYFEKLNVWQNARKMAKKTYYLTRTFPDSERYNLTSQIRRASTSIVANLAEGSSRSTKKDQAKFTIISYSSLMEVLSLLILSKDLNYIEDKDYIDLHKDISYIANQLNALKKSQLNSTIKSG